MTEPLLADPLLIPAPNGQLRLLTVPIVGLLPTDIEDANRLLVAWGHRLGPVNRPFRQEAFVLELQGAAVAVATSGSIVSAGVVDYRRDEVVELTRLCSRPDCHWATRVMLRLWRQACAPLWASWPVRAAISYSHNAMHSGETYRFDGWKKIKDDCGSNGGGTWSRSREATDAVHGTKSLWLWEYHD